MSVLMLTVFGNPEALDWLDDLVEERDVYFIHNTLEIISDYPSGEKPESWDCRCALAAAEMLAAARGNPPEQFPEEAREWLDAYGLDVDEEVMSLVEKALDRIQLASLLKDELDAAGNSLDWQNCVTGLRRRLGIV
jgi:Domain of unknown function (DUF4259)